MPRTMNPMLEPEKKSSVAPGVWMVRMNHRNRSALFAVLFTILGLHLADKGASLAMWSILALQCFVYPQLAYWRAMRAKVPGQAEVHNMLFDAAAFAMWAAVLGFPLWITFILLVSVTVNLALFRGVRGIAIVLAVLIASALATAAVTATPFSPETSLRTTAMCMVGVFLFLMVVAVSAYGRSIKHHETQEKLRRGESALQQANEGLTQQLQEINALQGLLSEQANKDALTGLYNRRYLESTMERELARCARDGKPLGLMLMDIDHFKKVNDTFGHQAGDQVLRSIAELLQVRSGDIACRYGGEEFLVLFPDMPREVTLERAELFRRQFEESTIRFGEFGIQATLSIGLANYPWNGKSADVLINSADKALYVAKSQGRNRVVDAETLLDRESAAKEPAI